ncbi:MAG TPA: hypothetical protein VF275_05605 [Gammaproteobacteria bacterium]
MSKLLKFKEWLTLEETVRHLSIIIDEEVTEADVLRLALDRHLQLSVNFVNGAKANLMRVIPMKEMPMFVARMSEVGGIEFPLDILRNNVKPDEVPSLPDEIRRGLEDGTLCLIQEQGTAIGEDKTLRAERGVKTLHGVWDLPLIGAECLDIEHHYQQLTGGPEITLADVEGPLVQSPEGELYRLLESWDENEFQSGSSASLEKLKQCIVENNIEASKAGELLRKHKADRHKFLEKQRRWTDSDRYYPAGGLPDDCVFVVRTSSVQEFQARMTDSTKDRPVSTRERNKYLEIIAALACAGWGWDGKEPYRIAKEIQNDAALKGFTISDRTLGEKLKEAVEHLPAKPN